MATASLPAHVTFDPDISGRRVLILGGGLWQREYVRRARELGAEVWLTDWSPDAVARGDAHHFAPVDLRDREGTLAFARGARIDAVLTPADVGVPTAAHVANALGLPGVAPELAERATNKLAMRTWAQSIGLPGPSFVRVDTLAAARAAMLGRRLPVIVKPVDNCSSRGVAVIHRAADVEAAAKRAFAASMSGDALIEEFMVGREGSIEAFVQDGNVTVLGICDKTKSPLPDRFDLELRYPGNYLPEVRTAVEEFGRTLVAGFGIRDGIVHIEFLVDDRTQQIRLIEFALRGCGSKVVTHLLPAMTGIDVVRATLRQALGLRTSVEPVRALDGVLHFLMFPPGRITTIRGVEQARRIPGVVDLTVERSAGDRIDEVHDGRSRPGHLLACAATAADVQAIVREVHSLVRVVYEDGRIMSPLPVEPAAR